MDGLQVYFSLLLYAYWGSVLATCHAVFISRTQAKGAATVWGTLFLWQREKKAGDHMWLLELLLGSETLHLHCIPLSKAGQ